MPSRQRFREAARQLRLISELTEHLPEDSLSDRGLRVRLELAADVLEAAAKKR